MAKKAKKMARSKKPVKRAKPKLKVKPRKKVTPKKNVTIKSRPVKSTKKKGPPVDLIGVITHYFPHVNAGVVKLKAPLAVGETIKIKGHTTDSTQIVSSMQIDRTPIQSAKKGDEIGLLVQSRVRRGDKVIRVKQ